MAAFSLTSRRSTPSVLSKLLNVINFSRLLSLTSASQMPPTLGPESPTPPLAPYSRSSLPLNRTSTTSLRSLADDGVTIGTTPACSSSSIALPLESVNGDANAARVEGLLHCHARLESRRYKSLAFAEQLLHILHALRVLSWAAHEITPDLMKVYKVSGSLTNDVFFVSCPAVPHTRTVLLRVYGPSSGALISRPRELHTLHVLSSQYQIGPRVYGTFENGRVEEYFESTALTADDLRDKTISSWIGGRMAELHGVDVVAVEGRLPPADGEENRWRVATEQNVESWLILARDVLRLPAAPEAIREGLDLDTFEREWNQYVQWLHDYESSHGPSRRVFSHNDTQYGNLLRLKTLKPGLPEHHSIIVVDFEYAGLNAAAFDIANHFHEWTANYHSSTPHLLNPKVYPTGDQRRNFYRAYLKHDASGRTADDAPKSASSDEEKLQTLEDQVRAWSPASHAMWSVWGVVQAREFLEGLDGEPEFDYLGYAQCRIDAFRREIRALGIIS